MENGLEIPWCEEEYDTCSKCIEKINPGISTDDNDGKVFKKYHELAKNFAEHIRKNKEYYREYIETMATG